MRTERGYSLLEMLGYLAILAVMVNLVAGAFISTSRLFAYGTKALDRLSAVDTVREDFCKAVREAHAIAPQFESYQSGPGQLVLRSGPPGAERYIVFGQLDASPRLCRLELVRGAESWQADVYVRYQRGLGEFRFKYDPDTEHARGVTLVIEPLGPGRSAARPAPLEYTAAFRGIGP